MHNVSRKIRKPTVDATPDCAPARPHTTLLSLKGQRLYERGQAAQQALRAHRDELDVKVQQRIRRDDGRRAASSVCPRGDSNALFQSE